MYIAYLFAAVISQANSKLPFLSPVFASHMVLQRDRPNSLWGWSQPGDRVTVSIADRKASAVADQNGKWLVRISPPPVGGPYTVAVDGAQHVALEDVLVGDVWICSGQSNMEMGIGMVNNAQGEIANANYPMIRTFIAQHASVPAPVATLAGEWQVCNPQNIASNGWGGFSAAAYFFGREVHQRLHIPIGLVETCWGGTIAEAWTSQAGLAAFPEFHPAIQSLNDLTKANGDSIARRLAKWMTSNDPGSAPEGAWAASDLDEGSWMAAPSATYEAVGLSSFDGVVWFREEVDLPNPLPAGPIQVQLGSVDDMDTTWVNGVQIGESYSVADSRQYTAPQGAFKPGRNVVVVRSLDTGGPGGMPNLDAQNVVLGDGTRIRLDKGWKYKVGADLKKSSPLPVIFSGDPNIPTVLFNGMIAPLIPLAVKGAIWYQGESNADRPVQYQRLLPALIADWRRLFKQGDFPFFVVQLANFANRHAQPVDDAWAELREAQAMTVSHVRNTGLAVAIDIGDHSDIHPKDKQDVGIRLALAALHFAYGQAMPYSGPTFRALRQEGTTLRIRFDHTDGGLKSSGQRLAGFQIAGSDHRFVWADARIEGNEVVVGASGVPDPIEVRYAWDMDPEATLYNGSGLPAVPFRSGH